MWKRANEVAVKGRISRVQAAHLLSQAKQNVCMPTGDCACRMHKSLSEGLRQDAYLPNVRVKQNLHQSPFVFESRTL